MHWTIHDLWGRWNCSGNKEGIVKQLEDEPDWVHEGLPVPFEVRGPTYMNFITSFLFDQICHNTFNNQLQTHLIADVIFGSLCLLHIVANCTARMETQKGWKNFIHDLDHIWWTSISNYRWLSTKIRIAGPKYCKDTTYVGEMRIMIVSNQLYWFISFVGCLFHNRRFLSQDEIETKEGILTWQVSEVFMNHMTNIRALRGYNQRKIIHVFTHIGMPKDLLHNRQLRCVQLFTWQVWKSNHRLMERL